MTKLISYICLAALAALFSCQPESGWTDLFNGENLEGWEILGAEESNFYVEEGMIVAETKMGLPNTFLATKKHYSDFELEAEFKVNEGMNTGIQIRSSVWEKDTVTPYLSGKLELYDREWKAGRVHGYQIEIDPSERAWTGSFYEEGDRGYLVPLTDNEAARAAYKPEDWNHLRVIANGNHFQTWINGVPAVDTYDDKASSGFIALQLHGIKSEKKLGLKTHWKYVRVKELN
jgi:hypothetical protein